MYMCVCMYIFLFLYLYELSCRLYSHIITIYFGEILPTSPPPPKKKPNEMTQKLAI